MRWTSEPSITTATATLFHVTPSGNLRTFFSSCQYTGVHISGKSGIIAVVVLGTLTGGVAQGCAFYLRFSCAKSVNSGTFVILQNKKIKNVWEPRPRTAIIPRNLAIGDGSLSSPCATFTERGGFQKKKLYGGLSSTASIFMYQNLQQPLFCSENPSYIWIVRTVRQLRPVRHSCLFVFFPALASNKNKQFEH